MRLEKRRLITLKRKSVRRSLSILYPLADELQEQGRISDISEAVPSNDPSSRLAAYAATTHRSVGRLNNNDVL
jgi:hypothetical protein